MIAPARSIFLKAGSWAISNPTLDWNWRHAAALERIGRQASPEHDTIGGRIT